MSETSNLEEVINCCCCVEIGSIIDGSECLVEIDQHFAEQAQAQAALDFLTQKARAVESEPCQISSEIQATEEGYRLKAGFAFACQAEAMIFQLATR